MTQAHTSNGSALSLLLELAVKQRDAGVRLSDARSAASIVGEKLRQAENYVLELRDRAAHTALAVHNAEVELKALQAERQLVKHGRCVDLYSAPAVIHPKHFTAARVADMTDPRDQRGPKFHASADQGRCIPRSEGADTEESKQHEVPAVPADQEAEAATDPALSW